MRVLTYPSRAFSPLYKGISEDEVRDSPILPIKRFLLCQGSLNSQSQALWNLLFENFFLVYLWCSNNFSIFAHDSVSPQGREGQDILVKGRLRTLSSESQISQIWIFIWGNATETSALGLLYPVHLIISCKVDERIYSRRGLTRVAYLDEGAMREPETWDKREVVTPTSFIKPKINKPKLGRLIGWIKKCKKSMQMF